MYEIFTPPASESRILDYRLASPDWKRLAFAISSGLICFFGLLLITYQWLIRQPLAIPAQTETIVLVRANQSPLLRELGIPLPELWPNAFNTSYHLPLLLGSYTNNNAVHSFALIPRWRKTPTGFSYRQNHGLVSYVSDEATADLTGHVTAREALQWTSLAPKGKVGFSIQPRVVAAALTNDEPIHGGIEGNGTIHTDLPLTVAHPLSGEGDWAYAPSNSPWDKSLLQQLWFGRLPLNLLPDQPSEVIQWHTGSSSAIEVRFAQQPSTTTIGLLGTGANLYKKMFLRLQDGTAAYIETPRALSELPTSTQTSLGFFEQDGLHFSLRTDEARPISTKKSSCNGLVPVLFFSKNERTVFLGEAHGHLSICSTPDQSASVDK